MSLPARPVLRPLHPPQVPRTETKPADITVRAGDIRSLPATANLFLYRGDDFLMTVTVYDPDGNPLDLTGATFLAQIRPTFDGQLSGVFTAVAADNVITLHLASSVSQGLPLRCVWDLRMEQGTLVTTLVAGAITLTADVSRPASET